MDSPLSDDEMADLGGQSATVEDAEICDAASNPVLFLSEFHSTTTMDSPLPDDEMVELGGQLATINDAEISDDYENLVLYLSASHSFEETLIPSSFISASLSASQSNTTMDSPLSADDAELLYATPALEDEFSFEDWDMEENVPLADAEDSLISLDDLEIFLFPASQPAAQSAVDGLERES